MIVLKNDLDMGWLDMRGKTCGPEKLAKFKSIKRNISCRTMRCQYLSSFAAGARRLTFGETGRRQASGASVKLFKRLEEQPGTVPYQSFMTKNRG